MNATPTIETRLVDVEDGYARVVNARTGNNLGTVTREKFGSTRTGTHWEARTASGVQGYGDTRAEAVALIAARHAKVAARLARQAARREAQEGDR